MSTTPDSNAPIAVRSSRSYADPSGTKCESASHSQLPLVGQLLNSKENGEDLNAERIAYGEEEIVRYGGDDIHEPPSRTPQNKLECRGPSSHPTNDPHVVDWNGPDDPTNPQNWSFGYKWCITIIAILMCMNVYVLILSHFSSFINA